MMLRLVANCRAEITQLFRDVCDMNRTDLVLLFTLLILLRHHLTFWYLSGPMIALTVADEAARVVRGLGAVVYGRRS